MGQFNLEEKLWRPIESLKNYAGSRNSGPMSRTPTEHLNEANKSADKKTVHSTTFTWDYLRRNWSQIKCSLHDWALCMAYTRYNHAFYSHTQLLINMKIEPLHKVRIGTFAIYLLRTFDAINGNRWGVALGGFSFIALGGSWQRVVAAL